MIAHLHCSLFYVVPVNIAQIDDAAYNLQIDGLKSGENSRGQKVSGATKFFAAKVRFLEQLLKF